MSNQTFASVADDVVIDCEYDSNCTNPVIPRAEYLLEKKRDYRVCRTHKKVIDELNVKYIEVCEWPDNDGYSCPFPALAMVGPPGSNSSDKIAVCRRHRAISRRLYASRRKE